MDVVYTETYSLTLIAVLESVEQRFGSSPAEKLLDRIDGIVVKIIHNPYLFKAIPLDNDIAGPLFPGKLHWFTR